MCIGMPSPPPPPVIPERQQQRLPDGGQNPDRADLLARRRRGMSAMILTGPSGTLGIPSTGSLGGG